MSGPIEHALHEAGGAKPRREALLPPTIILLVFAMVVVAVGGFAYVGGQQQALNTIRVQSEALRVAAHAVETVDADAAHVMSGEPGALAGYFRDAQQMKALTTGRRGRESPGFRAILAIVSAW